ncbi:hypothetical protein QK900_15660 (plasmid) [Arsenicicoccus dermatophilus]|uniref:hypothetical protein n=1 Tax=Arsenicicoccus dermatophilus TaxID=1076331 RepID=UPI0038923232
MSWILLAGLATGCLWLMRWTSPVVDAVLVRVAAVLYLLAGMVLAAGWLGAVVAWAAGGLGALAVVLGAATFAAVAGMTLVVCLGAWWAAALLTSEDVLPVPEWLVLVGLVLPSLMAAAPGSVGAVAAAAASAAGGGMDAALMAVMGR